MMLLNRSTLRAAQQSGYVMILVLLFMSQIAFLSARLFQSHTDGLIFDASFADQQQQTATVQSSLHQCEQEILAAYVNERIALNASDQPMMDSLHALFYNHSVEHLFNDMMDLQAGCYYVKHATVDIREVYARLFSRDCACDVHAFNAIHLSVIVVAFDGRDRRAMESRYWLTHEGAFQYMTFDDAVSELDKKAFYARYFKPRQLSSVELRL